MLDQGWAVVIAALVGMVGTVVVGLLTAFRKENAKDHAEVMSVLTKVSASVGRVEGKVDHVQDGLNDHLKEHNNGRFVEGAADSISKAKGKVSRRPAQGSR